MQRGAALGTGLRRDREDGVELLAGSPDEINRAVSRALGSSRDSDLRAALASGPAVSCHIPGIQASDTPKERPIGLTPRALALRQEVRATFGRIPDGGQIAAYKDGPLTVSALTGKTVGVQLATTYADAAKKLKGLKNIKTYKGDPEAFSALRAKKVDAWISDKFTVKATLDKNPDAGISAGEMVFVERVSMILRKNNKTLEDKLNQGLAEVMKDGTYKALSEKYFKEDISCRS